MKKPIYYIRKAVLSFTFAMLAATAYAQSTEPILRINTEMHSNEIVRIDANADDSMIITASLDKTAKLWDGHTGELLHTLRPPIGANDEGVIRAAALSPDGKLAAIGGWTGFEWNEDATIYLFSTQTGELIHYISGHPEVIFDLEFSPSGRYLAASLGGAHGVRVYELPNNRLSLSSVTQPTASLTEYKADSYNIAFDQGGRLATVSLDGKLRLYDADFILLREIETPGGDEPYSLAFSPDGRLLAVGYNDSPNPQVFDGKSLRLLYEPDMANTDGSLDIVVFSSDGQYLYGGGSDQLKVDETWWITLRRWDKAGRGVYKDFPGGKNMFMDIKPLGNGEMIFAGGAPDWGQINSEGRRSIFQTPEIHGLALRDRSHLRLSHIGQQVGFRPSGNPDMIFNIPDRRLIEEESTDPSFTDSRGNIQLMDWESTFTPAINGIRVNFLRQYERNWSVDIGTPGSRLVFGASWTIYCTNTTGEVMWQALTSGQAFSVNISGDGRVVVAAHGDGTLSWYRMSDGEKLLTLFVHPDNERWILYTPDGYYDAAPGAEDLIGWHVNNGPDKAADFYPIDRFFETYYRPDIISEVLTANETGGEIAARLGIDNTGAFQRPPSVRFTSPGSATKSIQGQITLKTEITDEGGGIDEVRLFHNGKLVSSDTRGFKMVTANANSITPEFEVSLLPGENTFRLTAFSKGERIESNPAEVVVRYDGAVANSDLYILAVGIDKYYNPSYNLNYATADASALVKGIQAKAGDIFRNVNVTYISDEEATKAGVQQAAKNIQSNVNQEDVFLFYYAGHGVMSEHTNTAAGDFYLALHDVTQLNGRDEMLREKGVSAAELRDIFSSISAQKQLIILDACQSGGAVETFAMRGAAEEKAMIQLARSSGVVLLASTGSEQFATEFEELGHGVFTYSILQGLSGLADSGDKKITVKELEAYLNDAVPELTQKYKGSIQFPRSWSRGMDFPISIVND